MEVREKVFVVSGASSGLGYATLTQLAQKGGRVIALDIHAMDEVKPDIKEIEFIKFFECDVRNARKVAQCVQEGKEYFGGLHGVVACAGVAPAQLMHSSRKGSHSPEVFMNTLEINLAGTFHVFNACIPSIRENEARTKDGERGVLIATSSAAAYEGQVGQAAYAASKGGVAAMVLPMARELARSGIRVNAIAPGIFDTPMMASFSNEVRKSLESTIPFPKRLGHPEEFANMVMHIIQNPYLNGTVVRLDGGLRME